MGCMFRQILNFSFSYSYTTMFVSCIENEKRFIFLIIIDLLDLSITNYNVWNTQHFYRFQGLPRILTVFDFHKFQTLVYAKSISVWVEDYFNILYRIIPFFFPKMDWMREVYLTKVLLVKILCFKRVEKFKLDTHSSSLSKCSKCALVWSPRSYLKNSS